ncbi:unnamed protein product [Orchesella dallaii]|uniref:Uncharacterized protein n=1 Tax=Orchesella dallaii TaxID=48710 RepID=A0ABP1R1T8_9HEXA
MHSKSARRLDFDNVLGDPQKKGINIFFQWFEPDTMGICKDRDNSNPGSVTPTENSISTAIRRHADDSSMSVCNSIKIGESLFGSSGMVAITLFKQSNYYACHCIPVSLREMTNAIMAMIHSYYRGCMKVAQLRLEEEMDEVKNVEDEEMEDTTIKEQEANKQFQKRMRLIKEAYEEFQSNLEQ